MSARLAIIDFGMGNLFSVQQACRTVGIDAFLTSSSDEVDRADAVILPGVGAFGDAMANLRRKGLDEAVIAAVEAGKLVFGMCLGLQLLFTESEEFGVTRGLGIVAGAVKRLPNRMRGAGGLVAKVPHVGWDGVHMPRPGRWRATPLEGVRDGADLYFVHSYYVVPEDGQLILSTTSYGDIAFCSSLQRGNLFGFQFHPERSGRTGIDIYRNIERLLSGAASQQRNGEKPR